MDTQLAALLGVSVIYVRIVEALLAGLVVYGMVRSVRRHQALITDVREMLHDGVETSNVLVVGGRYKIVDRLGTGGMARVYLARSLHDGQPVALKIPDPQFFQTDEHREYFRQELSVGTKMQHPNIVRILDFSDGTETGGMPYIALEYVHGETLDDKLAKHGACPLGWSVQILERVLAALEYAHNMGVVHRDIKPENIMLSTDGEVKVTDFGIARDRWDKPTVPADPNTFVGSPYYMSPEQINTDEVDYRTDYYALGVLAYRLFTGHLPFDGETTFEIITRKVSQVPPQVSTFKPDIPADLDQLVRDLIQKEPDRRPVSAVAIGKVLRKYLPRPGRRRSAASRRRTEEF
jgi:serine/threonine-protein kinase